MTDYKKVFLIINLLPFLFCKFPIIGKMIFINGTLLHGSELIFYNKNNNIIKLFKYWDISFNIFSGFYVNYTTSWVPYNYLLSLIAIISWQVNRRYLKHNKLVHLFLVQNILCLGTYYY